MKKLYFQSLKRNKFILDIGKEIYLSRITINHGKYGCCQKVVISFYNDRLMKCIDYHRFHQLRSVLQLSLFMAKHDLLEA